MKHDSWINGSKPTMAIFSRFPLEFRFPQGGFSQAKLYFHSWLFSCAIFRSLMISLHNFDYEVLFVIIKSACAWIDSVLATIILYNFNCCWNDFYEMNPYLPSRPSFHSNYFSNKVAIRLCFGNHFLWTSGYNIIWNTTAQFPPMKSIANLYINLLRD